MYLLTLIWNEFDTKARQYFILGLVLTAASQVPVVSILSTGIFNKDKLSFLVMFVIVLALYYIFFKIVSEELSRVFHHVIHKMRLNIAESIISAEFESLENMDKSQIYASLSRSIMILTAFQPLCIFPMISILTTLWLIIYVSFFSIFSFVIVLVVLIAISLEFLNNEIDVRDQMELSSSRDLISIRLISNLLDGFKEIKMNHKKAAAIYKDLKSTSQSSEYLSANASNLFHSNYLFLHIGLMVSLGMLVFIVFSIQNINQSDANQILLTLFFAVDLF